MPAKPFGKGRPRRTKSPLRGGITHYRRSEVSEQAILGSRRVKSPTPNELRKKKEGSEKSRRNSLKASFRPLTRGVPRPSLKTIFGRKEGVDDASGK